MYKAALTLEEHPKAYIGYTSSTKWKGVWDMPHFELDVVKEMIVDFQDDEHPMSYDEGIDSVVLWDEGIGYYRIIKGNDYHTAEGIKHLYAVGSGNWLWSEATERKCYYLAEGIEDFIYEYDTYGYRDVGIERDEMVEAIKEQLKELTTFQQVYEVWHDEELSQDERFEELSKLLTV